jgi:hypothetical protein
MTLRNGEILPEVGETHAAHATIPEGIWRFTPELIRRIFRITILDILQPAQQENARSVINIMLQRLTVHAMLIVTRQGERSSATPTARWM